MKSYFLQILRLTAFLLLCGWLSSCATKKAIEHTQQSQTTSIIRDTLRDSIYINNNVYVRDSVVIWQKGDTVYKDRWKIVTEYQDRWRDRWKTELKHDTIIKTDSLIVTKEKQLSKLQRLRMGVGDVSFVVVLLVSGLIVFKMIKK